MLFKIENRKGGNSTHCGVLEFVADEGMIYLPYWVGAPPCLLIAQFFKDRLSELLVRGFASLKDHSCTAC